MSLSFSELAYSIVWSYQQQIVCPELKWILLPILDGTLSTSNFLRHTSNRLGCRAILHVSMHSSSCLMVRSSTHGTMCNVNHVSYMKEGRNMALRRGIAFSAHCMRETTSDEMCWTCSQLGSYSYTDSHSILNSERSELSCSSGRKNLRLRGKEESMPKSTKGR